MTKIQQRLDGVISKVQRNLARNEFLIPQKTDQGIAVGNVLIVSRGSLKDLYQNGEPVIINISLNKAAIKLANWLAISPMRYQEKIKELQDADSKFGTALDDYQLFKDKYHKARTVGDQFRMDLYLARMCYSKDTANYWKNHAQDLAR
jgi:hypothetical protein